MLKINEYPSDTLYFIKNILSGESNTSKSESDEPYKASDSIRYTLMSPRDFIQEEAVYIFSSGSWE